MLHSHAWLTHVSFQKPLKQFELTLRWVGENIKVLNTLGSTATAPAAFALSEQYVKRGCQEEDDGDSEAEGEASGEAKKPRKGPKPGKKPKAKAKSRIKVKLNALKRAAAKNRGQAQVQALRGAQDCEASDSKSLQKYSPHLYAEQRKIFIGASGKTYKEACEAWKTSAERSKLLSQVSLGELKRRKFVPKGCQENPFC